MFRQHQCQQQTQPRFPRVRGDVPRFIWKATPAKRFSPRARGCSCTVTRTTSTVKVFPACAGMFPSPTGLPDLLTCFPRVRGDVPVAGKIIEAVFKFSPRARGCSPYARNRRSPQRVFPACAGMFLIVMLIPWDKASFPRVRGDVPR